MVKIIDNPGRDRLILGVYGRVDSTNALSFQKQIDSMRGEEKALTLDLSELSYISSAGLRVFMRLKKEVGDLALLNATPEVYEILDMTGFTSIMPVKRKLREISIENCPLIGEGGNGKVYRLSDEQIVKIFRQGLTLETIEAEQKASKDAFLLGVPCAIAFDNVTCNGSFGTVYEMIDASTLSSTIAANPDVIEKCAKQTAELLRRLHQIKLSEGQIGDAHRVLYKYLDKIEADFSPEEIAMIKKVYDSIPRKDRFVHNDFHCKNIMVTSEGYMLIDLGDAGRGNPIIDLIHCYFCYRLIGTGGSASDPDKVSFLGITYRQMRRYWDAFILAYFEGDEAKAKECEKKIAPFGALIYYTVALSHPRLPAQMHPLYASRVREEVFPHFKEMISTDFDL